MPDYTRRDFLKFAAATGAASFLELITNKYSYSKINGKSSHKNQTHKNPKFSEDDLEELIINQIRHLRQNKLIGKDEKVIVYVYDYTANKERVSLHADEPVQAASMIKPFVALAYFDSVERGKIAQDEKSLYLIECSIRFSDNVATNMIMEEIGGPGAVQRILEEHYSHIFHKTFVEDYIPITDRNRELAERRGIVIPKNLPVGKSYYKNLSSAKDYHKFFNALKQNELPGSKVLKEYMSETRFNRIISRIFGLPKKLILYNKTGTTNRVCGDIGLLEGEDDKGKKYFYDIISIFEKKKRANGYERGNCIRQLNGTVHKFMKRQYNLV